MKTKIYNKLLLSTVLLLGVISLTLVSCQKDDKEVVAVTLSAFGPSPALRGSSIKFIGTNLDKVSSVVLKNNIEIKDITHTGTSEMSIVIPQDAAPGVITLKSSLGDITSKTPLTFSEPISIDTYTTSSVKAGDIFTINGDYLNLISRVIFSDGVVVNKSNFLSQTRKKIEVIVPKGAKSGKVAISNGAEIPVIVFTSGTATITDPTTLTTISPAIVKPKSNLVIAGTYLNLVKSVIFPDGLKIDSSGIVLNESKTQMTVQVPEKVKEGTIKVVTYSGTEMPVPQALKLVAPGVTSLVSANVKNGGTLEITGTDLDLVTSVTFAGSVDGVITAQSETSLTVAVPLTATDGAAVLNTNSGLTASTAALTMIRPSFASISPLALTAGDNVTIVGTDLDLVRKVSFTGGSVAVSPAAGATLLTIAVPTTCVGVGSVTFETVNGTKVVSTDQLTIKASTTPAITSITPAVASGGLMIISGKNLNYVESIVFEDNEKAVLYGTRSESEIRVFIPVAAKHGKTTFTMISFDGEKIVSPTFSYGTDPIVDESLVIFDFEDRNGNNSANNAGGWGGIANGKSTAGDGVTGDFFEITSSNWNAGAYWWVADNWVEKPYPTISGINNYVIKMDIRLRNDIPVDDQVQIRLRISGNTEINFIPYLPIVNNKYSTGGEWVTIAIPTTGLSDPTVGSGDWGIVKGWNPNNVNFAGLCVDNIRYDLKSAASSSAPRKNLYGF